MNEKLSMTGVGAFEQSGLWTSWRLYIDDKKKHPWAGAFKFEEREERSDNQSICSSQNVFARGWIQNEKQEIRVSDFLLSLSSVMLLSMKNIHDLTQDFLSLSSKGTKIEIRKRKRPVVWSECPYSGHEPWPGQAAKHPLTRSVQRWFRLSFCTPFIGSAQFCKKPCNPVFNVLQFFKEKVKHSLYMLFCCRCSAQRLASRHRDWIQGLPCRKCSTNHCHSIRHWGGRFFFQIYCRYEVKKGKKFKTLQQNNAVLRRAALSGPKPAPDRAHGGGRI